MKRTLLLTAAMAVCLLAAACASDSRSAPPTALVDCTLIDGTGAPPVADAVVLIKDGRILAAGPRAQVDARGFREVSLHGAYLLPGFINAHVHSLYDAGSLKLWLASGVTSVRDAGYTASPDYIRRRDELNADPSNARLISATPMITHAEGYGTVGVNGPGEARAAVKRWLGLGADLLKIAIEDDLQGRTWPMMSAQEIGAAVAEAHAKGKRVSAHVSHVRNLRLAIDGGVDDLAHMVVEPLSEDAAKTVAAKGIAWVPTLELWKGVSEKHTLDWLAVALVNTETFFRAGGKIALGTDFNGYTIPFDTGFPITEARLLLKAGLSPMDVITAGTRNSAEVSGRLSDLGTVEKGKIADLLAVRRNPLEDIGALQETVQVFKAGRPVLSGAPEAQTRGMAGVPDDLAASFDAMVREAMRDVPGLAVAVTDESRTIWSRGYGWTDRSRSAPVTPDTLFAAVGISSAYTAAGVLIGRREGLVGLDAPISGYLPRLRLQSVFEERPEDKITLRSLLTHTAGLPEEAPYGNNYNLGEADFGAHVNSISRAWLRFPAGLTWAYSNLGPDLAGRVMEERTGLSFDEYMRARLYAPLGMANTSASARSIPAGAVRARGFAALQDRIPEAIAMAPSMGAFTSAADAARFMRLVLGRGGFEGREILDRASVAEMLSTPSAITGAAGLGVFKSILTLPGHNPAAAYGSSTVGFGYTAAMTFSPSLGIGIVVLANAEAASRSDVMNRIVNAIIDDPRTVYHDRLAALPINDPEASIPPYRDTLAASVTARLSTLSLPASAESVKAMTAWAGDYKYRVWGRGAGAVKIRATDGTLSIDGRILRQVKPGLFFDAGGNALEMSPTSTTWRGIPLIRIAIPVWQWMMLAAAILCLPALLVPAIVYAAPRRHRMPAAPRLLTPAAVAAAALNALFCALLGLALTQYPYLIGDGMPPLSPGVQAVQAVLIVSPWAVLGLTVVTIALSLLSWLRRFWSGALRVLYTILAGGGAVFAILLAVWRLM